MKLSMTLVLLVMSVSCSSSLLEEGSLKGSGVLMVESRGGEMPRKKVQHAKVGLRVKDVSQSIAEVKLVLKQAKGRVDDLSVDSDAIMEIRVPAKQLETTVEKLEGLGRVLHSKVWSVDVTEEWIDVHARLKNLKALRGRLRALYNQANKVEDLLKIEKEMARVQSELDSIEGKLRALRGYVVYSKIGLQLKRKRILGPLGLVSESLDWITKKLWVLN